MLRLSRHTGLADSAKERPRQDMKRPNGLSQRRQMTLNLALISLNYLLHLNCQPS